MNYNQEIREMLKEVGYGSTISFFYQPNKPTIQKDGIRYEILEIFVPDWDYELCIDAVPCPGNGGWKLHHLYVNESWRKSSWKHIRDIVENELKRRGDL